MSREFCYVCHRAKVACLCARIEKQPNRIKVIVLQHPDEASNAKGSAIIAELGLKQYQCFVAEDFTQHKVLNELINTSAHEMLLLYPAEQATELPLAQATQVKYLLVIDATWRKARKMWQSNPQWHSLACAQLAMDKISNYRIRKVPRQGYLSSVESIVEALRLLEGQPHAYQPLLGLFDEMVDFQIESMGQAVFGRNYQKK